MITVYSKNNCPHCESAKRYLDMHGIAYCVINIEQDTEAREFLQDCGHRSVPQIYMYGKIFVEGGWSGLSKMTAEDIWNEIDLRTSLIDQTI